MFELHPEKVSIRKFHQGIDFLGYIRLPHHTIMRVKTKKRMLRKLEQKVKDQKAGLISTDALNQTLQSYLGVLFHANTHKLSEELKNKYGFELHEGNMKKR